ncbi:TonB-dependent receptor plug domain-containing protein [Aliikangiella coralliicola]|uniref:TonB-dependent receptor n=1 Tax=Aliikangiella coralliicola TaxID=2592383 RepID=A0A545UIN0_9GAMM|nr:TonB-dependent receptor [Aliikangiella coralliicola]TQV89321.1 TonB-dependent receptor [Aliikangiella coralliicola]
MRIKLIKSIFTTISVTLLVLINFTCLAAEEKATLVKLSLKELLTLKIASRQNETIYSAPSSVTLITDEQLTRMGLTNLQAILNFVPGYQSSRDIEQGTANRITARGRSTALSESVLVLLDGQKLNDLYSGGVSILNRLLTLGHVEKIEIIRGPGSALYGSSAFLGAINIVTTTQKNQLKFRQGSFGEQSASLLFSHSFASTVDDRQNSSTNTLDLFIESFDQSGEKYQLADFLGTETTTTDPIDGHDLYLKYRLNQWSINARHMQRNLSQFMTFGALGNDSNQEETAQSSISLEYSQIISDEFKHTVKVSHSNDKWNTRALLLLDNTELAPGVFLEENFVGGPYLKSQNTKINWDSSYQFAQNNLLSIGLSSETAKISDVANVTTHNPITLDYFGGFVASRDQLNFNDRNKRDIFSFYIQERYQFNPNWQLTAGVRYDDYSDFGQSTNPRVAIVWSPTDQNSLKFLYGTAFRAPNFLELYDKNNPVDFGNVNLKAEKVNTTEVGWVVSNNQWNLEVTAFHNHFENLIVLGAPIVAPDNPLLAPSFSNSSSTHTTGIETEYQMQLMDEFQLKLIWNWFSDDSNINISKNTGAFILNYKWPDINFNLNSFYRGKNNSIEGQDSYFVTNANLRYSLTPKTTITFSSNNLFNEQYRTLSSVYSEGVANRGRSIQLGVEISF